MSGYLAKPTYTCATGYQSDAQQYVLVCSKNATWEGDKNILMITNLWEYIYGAKCICDISKLRPTAYINYISTDYYELFVEIPTTTKIAKPGATTNNGGQGKAKNAAPPPNTSGITIIIAVLSVIFIVIVACIIAVFIAIR